ncbi:MAG: DUF21 domain-containing protein [Phycisphaerales bacterium]|jgi:putative hemolysin|nr:DUF21 domain-containing protein [Phycisphaerales bacterium]
MTLVPLLGVIALDWERVGWWALLGFGVVLSTLASGVEMGCYSLNRVRLMLRASNPRDTAARRIRVELERPDRVLSTLMIAQTLAGAMVTQSLVALLGARGDGEIFLLNVLVVAPLMFIFCDAGPKELFRLEADRLTYRFAWPLSTLRVLFTYTGVMPALMGGARLIERVLRIPSDNTHIADARQRIALLLKEGSDGVLSESQSSLIDRALTFRSTLIGDEMIPWSQVRTISIEWDRARMVRVAAAQASSRLPVVDSKGRVLGVLRQIDLHTFPEVSIESLLRRPAMLSPSMGVLDALRRIRGADAPLGIVERDARPIGLVTAKDLVEPLTGELPDW